MRKSAVRDPEALAFIRTFIAEHGYAPTVREIGAALGIRGEGMPFQIITRLEKNGHLTRVPNVARNIRLTNPLERFSTDELITELDKRLCAPASPVRAGRESQCSRPLAHSLAQS